MENEALAFALSGMGIVLFLLALLTIIVCDKNVVGIAEAGVILAVANLLCAISSMVVLWQRRK